MQKLIEEAGLVRGGVKPYFSYIMLDSKTPTWSIEPPSVNTELAEFPKKYIGYPKEVYWKSILVIGIYSQMGPKQRLELELQQ